MLAAVIFVTLLFFPFIRVSDRLPGFEIIDILLPVLMILFLKNYRKIQHKKIYYFLGGFCGYIILTIIINSRLGEIRDYFEIIKILKFGLVIFLFSFISTKDFLNRWIRPVFVGLVVFNFIHYYELFNFNYLLEHYYQAGERLSSFGKNSLGYPITKRMLGFACNPNYNGIIFLFFVVYFIPKLKEKINRVDLIYFGVAITMVFLCQSRTALLSTTCVLIVYGVLTVKKELKKFGLVTLIIIGTFGLATFIAKVSINPINPDDIIVNTDSTSIDSTMVNYNSYEDSIRYADSMALLFNNDTYTESLIDGSAFESNSLKQRIAIWNHLWSMIMNKPVFGHGPYKEYFYDNELYSESEYFMIAWRYGFIGLLIFLTIFVVAIRFASKHLHTEMGLTLLLATVVLAVSCSTNNPFSHKTIIVLYGITIGLFLSSIKEDSQTEQTAEKVDSNSGN